MRLQTSATSLLFVVQAVTMLPIDRLCVKRKPAMKGRKQCLLILSRIETMSRRRGVFASSCISEHLEVHEANTTSQFRPSSPSLLPFVRCLQEEYIEFMKST